MASFSGSKNNRRSFGSFNSPPPSFRTSDFANTHYPSPSEMPDRLSVSLSRRVGFYAHLMLIFLVHELDFAYSTLEFSVVYNLDFAGMPEKQWTSSETQQMWEQIYEAEIAELQKCRIEYEGPSRHLENGSCFGTTHKLWTIKQESKKEIAEIRAQCDARVKAVEDRVREQQARVDEIKDHNAAKKESECDFHRRLKTKAGSIMGHKTLVYKTARPLGRESGCGLLFARRATGCKNRADCLNKDKAEATSHLFKLKGMGYETNADYLARIKNPQILNKETWDRLYGSDGVIRTSKNLKGWTGPSEQQHKLASMLHFAFDEKHRAVLESGEWLAYDDSDEEVDSPAINRRRVGGTPPSH
eukprot:scaffold353_cov185-Amphora_coffeaeformis.AAC.77